MAGVLDGLLGGARGWGAPVERAIEEVMLRPGGRAAALLLARFRLALLGCLVVILAWTTLCWPLPRSVTLAMCAIDGGVLLTTLVLYRAARRWPARAVQAAMVTSFALDLTLELAGLMSSGLTHSTIVVIPLLTVMTAGVLAGGRPAVGLAVGFAVAYPSCALLVANGRWPLRTDLTRADLALIGTGGVVGFALSQELFFALVLTPFLLLVSRLRRVYRAYQERLDEAAGRIQEEVAGRESDRARAAGQLLKQEQAYRLLADHVSDLVLLCDADLRLTFVSPSAAMVLGREAATLVGAPLRDLVHPDDWTAMYARLAPAAARGTMSPAECACEHRMLHQERGWRRFETRGSSMAGSPAGPGGAVLSCRDVTDHRDAEARLRVSEARFRTLVESLEDAVVTVDREGRLTSISSKVLDREGLTIAAVLGQQPADYFGPELGALHAQHIRRALAGEFVTFEWTLPHERRAQRPRGGAPAPLRQLHTMVSPLRDDRGDVVGAVLVSRDVTHLRALQERLLLSERMTSMGTLAAGVAHEINNPLAAVMANLDYSLEQVTADPHAPLQRDELEAALRESRDAADRVRQIVRTLKTFSRPDEARRERVELPAVIEAALKLAQNEIRHRARVERRFAPAPAVLANEARLGQVFLNLLVNAAQALPEGRADQNTITVGTATDEQGRVVVEVADTGAGIAPETLPRVFDPFFTTKPIGVGTGLGLSICQRIVSELGGEITVTSRVGSGTCFRVVLPAGAVEESLPTAKAPVPPAPRRGRILVIDDDPFVLKALERTLTPRHEVVACVRAAEALTRVREGAEFDLVICDLMMPEVTGMDVHESLRQVRPALAARTVFLTGGAFTPAARAFLDRVPNHRLEKPFEPTGLNSLVAQLLDEAGV